MKLSANIIIVTRWRPAHSWLLASLSLSSNEPLHRRISHMRTLLKATLLELDLPPPPPPPLLFPTLTPNPLLKKNKNSYRSFFFASEVTPSKESFRKTLHLKFLGIFFFFFFYCITNNLFNFDAKIIMTAMDKSIIPFLTLM